MGVILGRRRLGTQVVDVLGVITVVMASASAELASPPPGGLMSELVRITRVVRVSGW